MPRIVRDAAPPDAAGRRQAGDAYPGVMPSDDICDLLGIDGVCAVVPQEARA
jgi:hypothetical protein